MGRYKNVLVIGVMALALAGCDKIPFFNNLFPKKGAQSAPTVEAGPPPGAIVVAKVGNAYITSDDLNKEVEGYNKQVTEYNKEAAKQGLPKKELVTTRANKIEYLKNTLVPIYKYYQAALNRSFDKKPDIASELERAKVRFFATKFLVDTAQKIEVSSKEIEDFYNQNKDRLRAPEQRRVAEIMTPTEDEAKQVSIQLLQGGDFATLARQSSKTSSASNGGEVGWLSEADEVGKRLRFDKMYEVAFSPSLEAGGVSTIFKGADGFYIIKLEEMKKSETRPLSDLWDPIKAYLYEGKIKKAQEQLDSQLAEEVKAEIKEEKVE